MLLGIQFSVYADEGCSHHYKLYLRQDDSGYYVGLCTLCSELIDVYPNDYDLLTTCDNENSDCVHLFRKGDLSIAVSIEVAGSHHHEVAQWYKCVCQVCGVTIEAYETDGSYYWHEVSVWEDVHIGGEHRHLYVGHCDACGALQYDIVNCTQYEDGTCMGGWDFDSPVLD